MRVCVRVCVRGRETESERENVIFAMVFVSEILAILSISSLFIVPIDQRLSVLYKN